MHRLIAESGPMKGQEFAIPAAGLNLDGEGVTEGEPVWRIEIRGSSAAVIPVRDKDENVLTVRDGDSLLFRYAQYMYRSSEGRLDKTSCGDSGRSSTFLLSEKPATVGFTDEILAAKLHLLVSFIMTAVHKAKRGAILLDTRTPDAVLPGAYSGRPFPVDRSAIEAVSDGNDPIFINGNGTVCCVAIPEPVSFIYVEANAADPFDLADLEGLRQLASGACDVPDLFTERNRTVDKRTLIVTDEKTNLPPTFILITEPGTTLGPESEGAIPLLQRKFVALGTEILRMAVRAVPELEAAAVILTRNTPYGPAPEFWCKGVFEIERWIVATTLKAGKCKNVYGNICCFELVADHVASGILYVVSKHDPRQSPDQPRNLMEVAERASPLVRDIVDQPYEIIGRSTAIASVRKSVAEQAKKDTPVLIVGAEGTGRRLVAGAIHRASPRARWPFLWDLCGPSGGGYSTLERLYGLAATDQLGLVRRSSGGTLFLKGVGDLDFATQRELLRFLREGTYRRVGDTEWRPADLRIIASATPQLEDAVSEGRFLEDLYLELTAGRIALPELSEYRDDIPLLVTEFLRRDEVRHHVRGISPEAMDLLKKRRWKSNVRGLRTAVAVAAAHSDSEWIEADGLLQTIAHIR